MSQEQLQSTISNEEAAALPALLFPGEIIIVDHEEQIATACRDLASYPMIGFDTETRPSFKAGVSYKVSLLQLSTPTRGYLFRLHKIPFSSELIDLLQREDVVKVGADVAGDIRSLKELVAIEAGGFVDLQNMVWEWGVKERSLRKMAAVLLGHKISKAQRLSNWEAVTLTPQQERYAATDAWACIELYNRLQELPKLSNEELDQIRKEQARAAAEAAERRAKKQAQRKAKFRSSSRRRSSSKVVKEV
ncbi:MAG: 3'-5' exonuclease [Rikenellaceae bacterium]